MLPALLVDPLRHHINRVRTQYDADRRLGAGFVALPEALHRKYPNANREWIWQWLFPAARFYVDRATNQRRRHHFHESALQRAVRAAALAAGLSKRTTMIYTHVLDRGALCVSSPLDQAPPAKRRIARYAEPHGAPMLPFKPKK